MFDSKKTQLFDSKKVVTSVPESPFLQAGLKKAAITRSANGAVKYSTTGTPFVDQFGKLGSYKVPRKYEDIAIDMSTLWGIDQEATVKFTLYIRMITRSVSMFDGSKTETVQRGAGLRNEGIMRMLWIAIKSPETFWKNVHLFIAVGAWKDIIQMMSIDLQYHGWKDKVLDWDKFGSLLLAGLENPNTVNLVKKYLPQIKANSKCTTVEAQADNIIAKYLCSLLFGSKVTSLHYKKYRMLKTSGTAHQWQQLISQSRFLEIDFGSIHGRALALLVSSKFIENNKLTKQYEAWIQAQPVAKYTGFPHELFAGITPSLAKYKLQTIDKQFDGLVATAMKDAELSTNMIVVRDTSGSMGGTASGTKQTCYDIAKALALFFSYMLPAGKFTNAWIEFNSTAKMHTWAGSTPTEKWFNDRSSFVGSTEFMSVIKLLVTIKNQGVSESEFPSGIICISDSEFNPASLGKTNVESALALLRSAGFSEQYVSNFKIVLWNLRDRRGYGNKFETYGNVKNVFYFSGYDGSVISFLTGTTSDVKESTPQTAAELFEAAMTQEILDYVEL